MVEDSAEYLHLLLSVFVDELVCFVNDQEISLIDIEELSDAVHAAPYGSACASRHPELHLDCFHQVPASHRIITLDICHSLKLCILLERMGLALSGLSDYDAKPDILLTSLTHTNGIDEVPAFKELNL